MLAYYPKFHTRLPSVKTAIKLSSKIASIAWILIVLSYILLVINNIYITYFNPDIPTSFLYSPQIAPFIDALRVSLKLWWPMPLLLTMIGLLLTLLVKLLWQTKLLKFTTILAGILITCLLTAKMVILPHAENYTAEQLNENSKSNISQSPISPLILASAYGLNLAFANNFREVIQNKLYRSGEMLEPHISETIKKYNIKTVIDLRLKNSQKINDYDQAEKAIVEATGASYFHSPLASTRVIRLHELDNLLKIFDKATYPIWIHCSNGTHRSGFATLLWLIAKEGYSFDTAVNQLSLLYGFFHIERTIQARSNGHPTQDSVVWEFANLSNHDKISFIDWLKTTLQDYNKKRRNPERLQ